MASSPILPFKLWHGIVASATGDAVITDLPFTPDFVIVSLDPDSSGVYEGFTATSTTLTIQKSATTAAAVSYIAGNV